MKTKNIVNSITWIVIVVSMMISNSVQAQPTGNWFITKEQRLANEAAARAQCGTLVQTGCCVPTTCSAHSQNRYNYGYGSSSYSSSYSSSPTIVVAAKPMRGANGAVGYSRLHPVPNIPQSYSHSEHVDRNGVRHWKTSSVVRVEGAPVAVDTYTGNGTIVDTTVYNSTRYETRSSSGSYQTHQYRAPKMYTAHDAPKASYISGNPTVGGIKKAATPWNWVGQKNK